MNHTNNNNQHAYHRNQSSNGNPMMASNGGMGGGGAGHKEALVQKLMGAIDDLRKERDQAHRAKELAKERLRLALEEDNSLKKTVGGLKAKEAAIAAKMQTINKRLPMLESQVANMTQKMEFQHAELLKARDKIKVIGHEMNESATVRAKVLGGAQDLLHERRTILQNLEKETEYKHKKNNQQHLPTMEQQIKSFQLDVTSPAFDESDLPKLFQEKTAQLLINAEHLEKENDLLESVVSQLQGARGAGGLVTTNSAASGAVMQGGPRNSHLQDLVAAEDTAFASNNQTPHMQDALMTEASGGNDKEQSATSGATFINQTEPVMANPVA